MLGTVQASACPYCDTEHSKGLDGAHHVFVPYCTGDTYKGTRTTAPKETWGLYFDGRSRLTLSQC